MAKNGAYYLTGLKENNLEVLDDIYEKYLPGVINMVKKNNGSLEDAQDVFQEALVIIFYKANAPEFNLTVPFKNYLFAVCRNLWLRQLNKKHRTEITLDDEKGYILKDEFEPLAEKAEKWMLFQQKMSDLTEECRRVLEMFFKGIKLKEIASEMDYTEKYVKWKKYKCKEKLIELIKEDGRYWELIE